MLMGEIAREKPYNLLTKMQGVLGDDCTCLDRLIRVGTSSDVPKGGTKTNKNFPSPLHPIHRESPFKITIEYEFRRKICEPNRYSIHFPLF
jgi:hypothetical protein